MSSQILNKILGKSNSSVLFDFSKSIKENTDYNPLPNDSLPIDAERTAWDEINNLLIKDYNFESKDHMFFFLNACNPKPQSDTTTSTIYS